MREEIIQMQQDSTQVFKKQFLSLNCDENADKKQDEENCDDDDDAVHSEAEAEVGAKVGEAEAEEVVEVEEKVAEEPKRKAGRPKKEKRQRTEVPVEKPRFEKDSDRNTWLTKLTARSVVHQNLKECFKCISSGCDNRVTKLQPKLPQQRANAPQMLKAYTQTADDLQNLNMITADMQPFWLCGNHSMKFSDIDFVKLSNNYVEFCREMDYDVDESVLERLVRGRVSAPAKRPRTEKEEQTVRTSASASASASVAPEQLEATAKSEDILKVFDMLNPRKLKNCGNQKYLTVIQNSSMPMMNAQIVLYDQDFKICLVCELQEDREISPNMFLGFFSKEYTECDDATPEIDKTVWVSCDEETFVKAGMPLERAKNVVALCLKLSNTTLDNQYRR